MQLRCGFRTSGYRRPDHPVQYSRHAGSPDAAGDETPQRFSRVRRLTDPDHPGAVTQEGDVSFSIRIDLSTAGSR
jgi:hypothetical protein